MPRVRTHLPLADWTRSWCFRAMNPASVLCREIVEVGVAGCKYNHKYRLRCHAAKKFSEDPKNCTTEVLVRMPSCGHEFKVTCHQQDGALNNPTRCRMPCDRELDCGHKCQRKCGSCIERTIKRRPDFVLSPATVHLLDHGECQSLCDKRLICGHGCSEKCHPSIVTIFERV